MSQAEVYNPEDSLSDYLEQLPQRSVVFNIVLYLVRIKNINKSGICVFKVKK